MFSSSGRSLPRNSVVTFFIPSVSKLAKLAIKGYGLRATCMAVVLAEHSACTIEQLRHGMYILSPEVYLSEGKEAGIPQVEEKIY